MDVPFEGPKIHSQLPAFRLGIEFCIYFHIMALYIVLKRLSIVLFLSLVVSPMLGNHKLF